MGLLDQVLGGVVRSSGRGAGAAALMPALMGLLGQGGGGGMGGLGGMLGGGAGGSTRNAGMGGGGLGGLLNQFTQAGHGDVAQSWVGTGPNRDIAPHQLEEALGRDRIEDLSRQTGMGRDDLLSQLSTMLPHAVDQLTPQGRLPNDDEMRHW